MCVNDANLLPRSESETADRDSPSGVALNLTDFMWYHDDWNSRHPIYEFVIVCPKVGHLNYQFISSVSSFSLLKWSFVAYSPFPDILLIIWGGLFIIYLFIRGRFWIFWGVPGSMLSCFSDFLLFCFSALLLLCFSASLLTLLLCFSCFSAFLLLCFSAFCFPCFSAFPASLLFCFSVFPASLLLYFCAFLLLLFYYSSFLQSCVFAALLPAPLLLCFLSLLSVCHSFLCFILFCLSPKWNPRETLGETKKNLKKSW